MQASSAITLGPQAQMSGLLRLDASDFYAGRDIQFKLPSRAKAKAEEFWLLGRSPLSAGWTGDGHSNSGD
jgi:hypothetical protein